ncbi:MAG: hypothetical protein ACXVJ3_18445, partial [Ilumatobacteraceae bacterium]
MRKRRATGWPTRAHPSIGPAVVNIGRRAKWLDIFVNEGRRCAAPVITNQMPPEPNSVASISRTTTVMIRPGAR